MKISKLNSKGFTIVELLIVIVIIGILATIGFVSFSSAQNKAKKSKTRCSFNTVKSKLGEYFADNNSYPSAKADVVTYLNGNGGTTTATEFGDANYGYSATPAGCTTAANDCTAFTLTASKAYWNGGASDSDLSVTE